MTVEAWVIDLLYFLFRAAGVLIAASAALYLAFALAMTIFNGIVSLFQPPDRDMGAM